MSLLIFMMCCPLSSAHRAWQQGRDLPAEELAREYSANLDVLRKLLQYNSVPAVTQAADGRLVGSWPE
jgi:hypothetical protein